MRKKGEESGKKPEKMGGILLPVLIGSGVSIGLTLLLVLGLAGLIWSGILPATTPSIVLSFCAGLCAFVGGRFAIGKGREPMVTGIATGAVLAGVVAMICLSTTGEILFHGQFLATILLILAGGALSGLFGGKKKRKKKKKK